MSVVFFDAGVSLDGFMAGENRGPNNPLGDNGPTIHQWMYQQKAFWKHLGQPAEARIKLGVDANVYH